ncbi:NADH-cytochrome b5 reductase-like protein [Pyrus communis]|uniref:NADH-cytochrome b5 reductase-like protein n=1 Tax=Pyrus communis TaxID=23211 RepID=UPI0035C1B0AD
MSSLFLHIIVYGKEIMFDSELADRQGFYVSLKPPEKAKSRPIFEFPAHPVKSIQSINWALWLLGPVITDFHARNVKTFPTKVETGNVAKSSGKSARQVASSICALLLPMATFFQRLAKAAPIAFNSSFRGQSKSSFRIPFGAVAAVSGGISYLCYHSSPDLIAGGTGITPMLQVIEAILKNPDDTTQVSLLYANVSPDDILLKQKLDILAASHPNLKVFYTVDNPTKSWIGGKGYISKDMAVKGLPAPGEDTLILVCGPPGMMKHISGDRAQDRSQGELSGILKELGYTEEMVFLIQQG